MHKSKGWRVPGGTDLFWSLSLEEQQNQINVHGTGQGMEAAVLAQQVSCVCGTKGSVGRFGTLWNLQV